MHLHRFSTLYHRATILYQSKIWSISTHLAQSSHKFTGTDKKAADQRHTHPSLCQRTHDRRQIKRTGAHIKCAVAFFLKFDPNYPLTQIAPVYPIYTHGYKSTWISTDGKTHSQIDHVLVDRQRHINIMGVRAYRWAEGDIDHQLVITKKGKIMYWTANDMYILNSKLNYYISRKSIVSIQIGLKS